MNEKFLKMTERYLNEDYKILWEKDEKEKQLDKELKAEIRKILSSSFNSYDYFELDKAVDKIFIYIKERTEGRNEIRVVE